MHANPAKPPVLDRILIVDDDSDLRTIISLALHQVGGFTVHVCQSGREALASAPAWKPDLIILDILMPDMDGWQTLTALRAVPQTASTPIIMLTATPPANQLRPDQRQHMLGLIAKPFDPLTLATQVRALWAAAYTR